MYRATRRTAILAGAAALSGSALAATRNVMTPGATEGPFYPDRLPLDTDNDLARVSGRDWDAEGEIFHLFGRVKLRSGLALPGAVIEIWQCDANGIYRHSRAPGRDSFDQNFQGFGRTTADTEGDYRFRTITPAVYPGRTPHIHVRVLLPNGRRFTTQMYLDGHPLNKRDFLLSQIGDAEQRRSVLVARRPATDIEKDAVKGRFDIVLA